MCCQNSGLIAIKLNIYIEVLHTFVINSRKVVFQLDDEDEEPEFRHSLSTTFPAPMPWPPAIVSQQNQIQNEQNASGKKKKPGIIYLSSIPTDYNVARTITFFSQFGKVGRVVLQPGEFNAIVGTIP